MAETSWFAHPVFSNYILPFLLIFTLIFAILEKSKILGEGKKQINAIISLVIGLILIGYSNASGMISKLIPFLAVAAVVILVLMILFAMVMTGKEGFEFGKGMKITLGIVIGVAVIVAALWATGAWPKVYSTLVSGQGGKIWMNVLFIAIIIAAIATLMKSSK